MANSQSEPVAIIGLAGIFPGSMTVRQFFENVLRKRCFVRDLPDWLWDQSLFYSEDPAEPLKSYSRIGALLGDIEIDLTPFRIPPAVAAHMSLNQKLALLCARDALVDAGYSEGSFDRERVGVIMAAVTGEGIESRMEALLARRLQARLDSLARDADQRRTLEEVWRAYDAAYPAPPITEDTLPGELGSLVAGRIASAFDLHGMNLTIDSACASSLAAVSMGMTALRTDACDLVIAGGVDMDMSAGAYVTFSKVNALSGTGSYPFDERSNGFVMGEGCGVLLLKRFADAVRDGDLIYALIHGYGSSSDGAGKGITAPSTDGQLRALRRAYEATGLTPAKLDFLECHGTGTQVGDAEELVSVTRLLKDASLGPIRESPLPISTAKAMVGHLKTAAGMAGLFRAVLAINSRVIPPQVNFEHPNPRLDWERSLLRVPTRPEPIGDRPVTVGVSSLGFGGTNFHLILGTSPANAREAVVAVDEFVLPELPQLGGDLALLFPGQGSQYVGMLGGLRGEPEAEAMLARADRVVREVSGRSLIEAIYPSKRATDADAGLEAREAVLRATATAQPVIFTLSAILFDRVRKLGLKPGICLGHSLGEYTALYAAGILDFEDAVRAVAIRGQLMETLEGDEAGSMAFVSADRDVVGRLLVEIDGYLTFANLNSYDQVVVAGEMAAVDALVERALALGLPARTLNVDRAFHSRFLEPCIAPMRQALASLSPRYSATPVPANVSRQMYPLPPGEHLVGEPMQADDRGRMIDLLCQQIDHPVDFVAQVELAYEAGARRFVEVGPKNVLTRLVEDMLQGKPFQALSLDSPGGELHPTLEGLLAQLTLPLSIPRRPLATKPRVGEVRAAQAAVPSDSLSPAELVRSVVAQVSGYDISQIDDEAEFERDLGIDTLKILQIVVHLRGRVLPQDFTDFRRATSVRKILAFSESEGGAGVLVDGGEVRCYDYEVVTRGLATEWPLPPPRHGYRLIPGPGLTSWDAALPGWRELAQDESNDALIGFPLPTSAEALSQATIPQLLSLFISVADKAAADRTEPEVHVVSLAAGDGCAPAMYRALCGFVKSCQRDLPYVRFSYTHVDQPQPDADLIRRVLASPMLGRWIRSDGVVEEGTLVHRRTPGADPQELAALLGPEDVVLVTGGARGIAARIVQHLLPRVGARFLLVGRKPQLEDWITTDGQGRVGYLAADLADDASVRRLGLASRGVTLVIHAAGTVISRPIREIQTTELDEVLGGKVLGLERVLRELEDSRLRGLVNFSSIAAYFGDNLHPDYGAANGYLDGFSRPGLPVLSIGWSAWAEVGMASRSVTKEFLELAGVEPIPVKEGVGVFTALLTDFLKQAMPGTKNTVVRAGMAESIFLKGDPFREAMIARTSTQAARGKQAFRVTDAVACLPDVMRDASVATGLQAAILPLGEGLSLEETGVIVMRLPMTATISATAMNRFFTSVERQELDRVEATKRRPEKMAGKLAAKILASEALRRWHGLERDLTGFQVSTSDRGVEVRTGGDPTLDPALEGLHFSISHSEDIVCAAVASRPVGIDVERIRPLPTETTAEILGDMGIDEILARADLSSLPDSVPAPQAVPIAVFCQKEAVLKAAGVGIGKGIGDVHLAGDVLQSLVAATHLGTRYRATSVLDDGYAFSLACEVGPVEDAPASMQPATKPVAASYGQEGLWYLEKMEGIGSTHCVAWTERLWGALDRQALSRALEFVADRHEALRTVLREVDGRCRAEVLASVSAIPSQVDLSQADAASAQGEIDRRIEEEMRAGFDLARGPLMRAVLFRLRDDEHILLMIFHHVVIDASSAFNFRRELAASYRAFSQNRIPALPPVPLQYGEYAQRQRERLAAERLDKRVSYWRGKLAGHPGVLDLPTDRARPVVQTYRGGSVPLAISDRLDLDVGRLSGSLSVTPFVTYLAALQALLMRLSGQEDVVVGAPFVGREDPDTFPLVGYFVNTLPMRADLSGNPRFRDVLPGVRTTVMEALEHQEFPFPRLVEALSPHRDAAYPALFQVVLRLWPDEPEGVKFEGLTNEFTELAPKEIAYDLSAVVGQGENSRHSRIEYNSDLFEADTVQRMAGQYVRLLEAVVANPALRLWEIPLLSEAERTQVVQAWNDTQRPIPDRAIHDLFAGQAERTPRAVALAWDHGSMTYGQLNERANQLAHHLQGLGVEPEDVVGVAMDRSPEMVVGLLGILKAGAAYLPLDPDDPQERLLDQVSDAGARLILTQGKWIKNLPPSDATVLRIDGQQRAICRERSSNPETGVGPDHLAYVMYTSGSTGRPKGVEIVHRSIVRLVFGVEYAKLDPAQSLLHLAPLSFDASTFEIWGALLHGGKCVLYPDRVPTLEKLGRALRQHRITTLFLTTSLFNTVIDEAPETLAGVQQLLTGGEAHSVSHVRRALDRLPETQIVSVYGPTEATTFTCFYPIPRRADEAWRSIPIGRPIGNTTVYVLDRSGGPMPVGVPGELHIGGLGLARGYLNQPSLTEASFIPDPFHPEAGARLYKTGDIARWLPDGNLEFLGRNDRQVKIRGHRIELEEVEAVLSQYPAVQEAAVLLRDGGATGKRLEAHVSPRGGQALEARDVQTFLRMKLPAYMLPSTVVIAGALPKTVSGKVDRQALASRLIEGPQEERAPSGPRDESERRLTAIWEDVLGVRPIGVQDDFFDLGGHSLLAVRLFAAIERMSSIRLPVSTILQVSTVGDLADLLRREGWSPSWPSLVPIQPHGAKTPVFCVHWAGGNVLIYRDLARHLAPDQPVYGIQAVGLDRDQLPHTRIEDMAGYYVREIQAFQREGPYHLVGASMGGMIAFEMAQQLHALGADVGLVGLFDTTGEFESRPLPIGQRARLHADNIRGRNLGGRLSYPVERLLARTRRLIYGQIIRNGLPLPRFLRDLREISYQAALTYRPRPYPGKVTLFRARQRPAERADDIFLGWDKVAGGGMEVHEVAGDHVSLMKEPQVGELAAELRRCLEWARESG